MPCAFQNQLATPNSPDASVVIQNHIAALMEGTETPPLPADPPPVPPPPPVPAALPPPPMPPPREEPAPSPSTRSLEAAAEASTTAVPSPPPKSVSSPQIARYPPLLLVCSRARLVSDNLLGRWNNS